MPAPESFRLLRWIVLALVGVGIVALISLTRRREPQSLPVLGTVPEFSLTDQNQRAVSRSDLQDNVVVVDFIFTRCGGTCPVMTSGMASLDGRLGGAQRVKFVSISVDPDYDTPEVLLRYAGTYKADPRRWIFLTGDKALIYRLARQGFHLGVADSGGGPNEPIIHSTKFVLLDRHARIRGYYDGTEDDGVARLTADVSRLLAESDESQ